MGTGLIFINNYPWNRNPEVSIIPFYMSYLSENTFSLGICRRQLGIGENKKEVEEKYVTEKRRNIK
jgi:hypothetical protein